MDRWQRLQVNDDGSQVLVGKMAVVFVGHHRKQSAAVVADAFAAGARQLVVGPIAGAGFRVRRDVGRADLRAERAPARRRLRFRGSRVGRAWSSRAGCGTQNSLGPTIQGLLPCQGVAVEEIASYRKQMNRFGLPLDNRTGYTKLDWEIW